MTLSENSLDVGFSDQSHYTKVFRRFVGVLALKVSFGALRIVRTPYEIVSDNA